MQRPWQVCGVTYAAHGCAALHLLSRLPRWLQIIDLMVLVVDAGKGIQTQTAECIVIGEVAAADMVVALNKIGEH